MKKTFIILNGKTLRIIEHHSMAAAITSAQNTCDHSQEIIVREIDYNLFTDHKAELFTDQQIKEELFAIHSKLTKP